MITTIREKANCFIKKVSPESIKKVVKFVLKILTNENLNLRYKSSENATPEKIPVARTLITI